MKQAKIRGGKKSQEDNRNKVVAYLKSKAGTHNDAALCFGLSKSAVDKIWLRYKANKKSGIASKVRGIKKGWKLTEYQKNEIQNFINQGLPREFDHELGLWTVDAVQKLVFYKYDIKLSRRQAVRYLEDWGYYSQELIGSVIKTKSEYFKRWHDEIYPEIKKRAKKENAIIYFGDETGMQTNHLQKFKKIKDSGARNLSINMISAINNIGHLEFMIVYGWIYSKEIGFFLELLRYGNQKKIYFITDNPIYKTKKLANLLSETGGIELISVLPPDDPLSVLGGKLKSDDEKYYKVENPFFD